MLVFPFDLLKSLISENKKFLLWFLLTSHGKEIGDKLFSVFFQSVLFLKLLFVIIILFGFFFTYLVSLFPSFFENTTPYTVIKGSKSEFSFSSLFFSVLLLIFIKGELILLCFFLVWAFKSWYLIFFCNNSVVLLNFSLLNFFNWNPSLFSYKFLVSIILWFLNSFSFGK